MVVGSVISPKIYLVETQQYCDLILLEDPVFTTPLSNHTIYVSVTMQKKKINNNKNKYNSEFKGIL